MQVRDLDLRDYDPFAICGASCSVPDALAPLPPPDPRLMRSPVAHGGPIYLSSAFKPSRLSPWHAVLLRPCPGPQTSDKNTLPAKSEERDKTGRTDTLTSFVSASSLVTKKDDAKKIGAACAVSAAVESAVASMEVDPAQTTMNTEIVGLGNVQKLIREKIVNPILRPDIHCGLYAAPRGILLFGPPGTGKTLLARWICAEAKARFFSVSPAALLSRFHGETESTVSHLFNRARETAPSVIFFDEIDAVLSRRGSNEDETALRMKNQLLQEMDGVLNNHGASVVVLIGATNRPEALDDAALRRMTKRVLVPLPESTTRFQQIIKLTGNEDAGSECHRAIQSVADELDGWSCSDIHALCSAAAETPYEEALELFGGIENIPSAAAFRKINARDLRQAMTRVKPAAPDQAALIAWAAKHGCV